MTSRVGSWPVGNSDPFPPAAASGMFRFPAPRGRRKETKTELRVLTAGEQLKKLLEA